MKSDVTNMQYYMRYYTLLAAIDSTHVTSADKDQPDTSVLLDLFIQ
jgi:hypothetical protein